MSIFDKFRDKRSPREKQLSRIDKELQAVRSASLSRDKKIATCYTELQACDRSFENTIMFQRATAQELEKLGAPATNERNRIRQAAMGRVVVKRALIQLNSISSEQDLNSAINMLGIAIRQMHRIENFSTEGVGVLNQSAVKSTMPDNQDDTVFDLSTDQEYEVPQEIVNKVDDTFVDDLLDGKDFEACLKASATARKPYSAASAVASAGTAGEKPTSETFNKFADKM